MYSVAKRQLGADVLHERAVVADENDEQLAAA
jgi:hypothetical protein